jgi:hypothetical protein
LIDNTREGRWKAQHRHEEHNTIYAYSSYLTTENLATTNCTGKLGGKFKSHQTRMTIKIFTKEEIIANLEQFSPKKAPAEDGLSSDILKSAFQVSPLFFK